MVKWHEAAYIMVIPTLLLAPGCGSKPPPPPPEAGVHDPDDLATPEVEMGEEVTPLPADSGKPNDSPQDKEQSSGESGV